MIREMFREISKEMVTALAISLAIIALVLALVVPPARRTGELTSMARTWFESVGNGRPDDAYELLVPAYRASTRGEQFRIAISENPRLRGFRSFELTESEVRDDRASMGGELRTDAGQFEAKVHFGRAEEPATEESWYVTEILVNGATILPR